MSPERAVEIIENLVDGIHPLTGESLPESNICEETGIVDALNYAIQVLNERIEADRAIEEYHRRRGRAALKKANGAKGAHPENAGKPWSPGDDAELMRLYKAGTPVAEIARRYRRTEGAIRSRLVKLGLADHRFRVQDVYVGYDPIDNDELRHRLLYGETIPELARRYGRTEKAIRARLFYMGFGGDGPNVVPPRKKDDPQSPGSQGRCQDIRGVPEPIDDRSEDTGNGPGWRMDDEDIHLSAELR